MRLGELGNDLTGRFGTGSIGLPVLPAGGAVHGARFQKKFYGQPEKTLAKRRPSVPTTSTVLLRELLRGEDIP